MVRSLQENKSPKTRGISRLAHFFSTSILDLAEHFSSLSSCLLEKSKQMTAHLWHNAGTSCTPTEAPHTLCTHSLKRCIKDLTRACQSGFMRPGTLSSRLLT